MDVTVEWGDLPIGVAQDFEQYYAGYRLPFATSLFTARIAALGIPLVTVIVALAMVSSIRYSHFVNRVLRSRRTFPALVRIVLPVLVAIWWPREMLAAGFVIYALSGPVIALLRPADRAPQPTSP